MKSANLAVIAGSPAVKRQRTAEGYTSRDNSGYNSAADSGDDLFEGVITTPAPKHFTQPTQIIDRTTVPSSPSTITSPEVQVLASSPFRQEPASSTKLAPSVPKVGRLASLMAPAGTAFRAPYVPPQAKKPFVIDLSDDDGPQYKGGSSDEDELSRAEIKPSSFIANKSSFASSSGNSFKDIVANARYDPTKKSAGSSLLGSAFDARNREPTSKTFQLVSPAAKRPADSMSMGYGTQRKPQTQTRPERAMPVQDMRLEDEKDQEMRRKIFRLKSLNPSLTVLAARNALIASKGNVDDAALILMSGPIEISDDDDDTQKLVRSQQNHLDPQMKRQLKAPIKSIQERYSSTQNPRKVVQPVITPPKKPRKRLQQGRRHASSPVAAESPKPQAPQAPKQTTEHVVLSDYDSADSGIGSESEEDPELEGRVLNFINKCKAEDLADLANIKVEVAAMMIAQRPFKDLDAARNVSDGTTTKAGKRSTKQPIGEKIVQTSIDMWSGYEAVDALVAKCEQLGKPLAEEIAKWGFNVFGASKAGELEMTSLEDDNESQRDSGIGTPSSKAGSANGEGGEEDIKSTAKPRQNRQAMFLKKPTIMSDEITLKDYQLVGLNWLALLYKHKLSCILADDMGLGKTCQVIAFLSHLAETGIPGPHLVIVPPSTLENWLREFQLFCPNLVVEPYYGMYFLVVCH
jgi:SWI/SNF-related matrix-associated actin-dependent regulator 1 of chromatin subfamily A